MKKGLTSVKNDPKGRFPIPRVFKISKEIIFALVVHQKRFYLVTKASVMQFCMSHEGSIVLREGLNQDTQNRILMPTEFQQYIFVESSLVHLQSLGDGIIKFISQDEYNDTFP